MHWLIVTIYVRLLMQHTSEGQHGLYAPRLCAGAASVDSELPMTAAAATACRNMAFAEDAKECSMDKPSKSTARSERLDLNDSALTLLAFHKCHQVRARHN